MKIKQRFEVGQIKLTKCGKEKIFPTGIQGTIPGLWSRRAPGAQIRLPEATLTGESHLSPYNGRTSHTEWGVGSFKTPQPGYTISISHKIENPTPIPPNLHQNTLIHLRFSLGHTLSRALAQYITRFRSSNSFTSRKSRYLLHLPSFKFHAMLLEILNKVGLDW